MAASIDHPNVLPVFGAGETDDGMLWLSMRLVTGADLRSLAPLPATRAAAIVAQVGAALDAAHERRLVHRDVKPANVLVTASDHAYLTDFGLVKALDHGSDLTRTGEVVGTLDYIAPERIRGAGDGPAADLYSLGCLLYFALTGRARVRRRGHRAEAVGAPVRAAAGRPGLRRRARPRAGEGAGGALRERRRPGRGGDRGGDVLRRHRRARPRCSTPTRPSGSRRGCARPARTTSPASRDRVAALAEQLALARQRQGGKSTT